MYISDVHTYTYLCIIVHILICTVFLLPPCTSWLYVGINVCLFTCGNNFYCGKSSNFFSKGPKKTYVHTQYPPNINVNVTGYMHIYIYNSMHVVSKYFRGTPGQLHVHRPSRCPISHSPHLLPFSFSLLHFETRLFGYSV